MSLSEVLERTVSDRFVEVIPLSSLMGCRSSQYDLTIDRLHMFIQPEISGTILVSELGSCIGALDREEITVLLDLYFAAQRMDFEAELLGVVPGVVPEHVKSFKESQFESMKTLESSFDSLIAPAPFPFPEIGIVNKVIASVDNHPAEIHAGQIWGISSTGSRYIVLSSPAGSITGRDVRIIPVTNKVYAATASDFILPKGMVYHAESVVHPYRISSVLTERLDLYYGEIGPVITKALVGFDRTGELKLPEGTVFGNTPEGWSEVEKVYHELEQESISLMGEVLRAAEN